MRQFNDRTGLAFYLKPDDEYMVVAALRFTADNNHDLMPGIAKELRDYADALENDTWLLETSSPPEDV